MEEAFSLLWPKNSMQEDRKPVNIGVDARRDLKLESLAKEISMDYSHQLTSGFLISLFTDDNNIIQFRLDIMEDLIKNPEILTAFEDVIPQLELMKELNQRMVLNDMDQRQSIKRMVQLENYVACINKLTSCFTKANCSSEGLKNFIMFVTTTINSEVFQSLSKELERLRQGLSNLQSITVGFNLDRELRPVEAVVLSLNDYKIREKSFLEKFDNDVSSNRGISSLYAINKEIKSDEFAMTVFNNLNRLMKPLFRSVAQTMGKYVRINTSMFINLKPEFEYWIGAVRFFRRLSESGLNLCKPQLISKEKRWSWLTGMYNVLLATELLNSGIKDLNRTIVTNDVKYNEGECIFIITGPNQGGKTTYTQGIALAYFLCQIGLYIPATEAVISSVDNIFTHFPVEEKPEAKVGRLGEESKRLGEIFDRVTKYSLVLLNESLCSTSPGESLYLSQEVVRAFKVLGARVYFNTHLHELAESIDDINESMDGSKIVSLIAGIEEVGSDDLEADHQRTYKVFPAPPLGNSYARDIANRYGLSYDAITGKLKNRMQLECGAC